MKLALLIHTEDGGALEAETEDISANGILFIGKKLPKVESRIEFTIKMPAAIMGTLEDVSIQCTGRVVRHQKHGDMVRAAAIIDEYLLRA